MVTGKDLKGKLKIDRKIPSIEVIFQKAWECYYGGGDCWVQRDVGGRRKHFGGAGNLRWDRYRGEAREDDDGEEDELAVVEESDLNDDGAEFVSVEEKEKLGWMLGREIRGEGNFAYMGNNIGAREDLEERTELLTSLALDVLPIENPKYYSVAYGTGRTIGFHEEGKNGTRELDRMLGWMGPGTVDLRMALDYFPALRGIGLVEKLKDDVESSMGGTILNDSSDLRRSSRRSGKGKAKRQHKFDSFGAVCGRAYVGRNRGAKLAGLCMLGDEWERR